MYTYVFTAVQRTSNFDLYHWSFYNYSQLVYWRVLWTTCQVNWVQSQVLPFACFVAMGTGIRLPECEILKWTQSCLNLGFPGGASGKESACQCRRWNRYRFDPWVRKIPWSREWQPTPIFLPRQFHGQRNLRGYSPWGCKESDSIERLSTLYIVKAILKHN